MTTKVAVVTGSNKGIGYAIVRGLCTKFDGDVYLTSRNVELGEEAVSALKNELGEKGVNLKYHQLDITDVESITSLRDHLQEIYGGIDLLVNNAGIAFCMFPTEPLENQPELTLKTNYFGTMATSEILFPLLRKNARVVNISSRMGTLEGYGEALKETLTSDKTTTSDLNRIADEFIQSPRDMKFGSQNWPGVAYRVSKALEISLTFVQQREVMKKRPNECIQILTCSPGFTSTSINNFRGTRTLDEGAKTPLYLCFLPYSEKNLFKLWREKKAYNWEEIRSSDYAPKD